MSRISDILIRARDTLADPTGQRWSDERLLRLIDEAQKDICRRAKLLRTKQDIGIYNGKATYDLPDDLLLLDRILLKGKVLPLQSHLQLDKKSDNWEEDKGYPVLAIYDKQSRKKIKLYPIPDNLGADIYIFSNPGYFEDIKYIQDNFGVVTSAELGDSLSSDYGITTDVDFIDYVFNTCDTDCDPYYLLDADMNSDYGIMTELTTELKETGEHDPDFGIVVAIEGLSQNSDYGVLTSLSQDGITIENFNSEYGVTTEVTETFDSLTVYYLRKPKTIASIDDELDIDDIYDSAIKYYIVGKALRDDMDTQNRTVGNEELKFYDRELAEAIKDDVMDFTRNSNKQYEFNYQGAF